MGAIRKKRKFEMGRPAALTKLGAKRIHSVRCRGGNIKYRALRLESGNFNWPTEATTAKTRILTVLYNASNNELVRTNTLVKNCIVQIDATPFRQWYKQHYGVEVGKKKAKEGEVEEETKQSKSVQNRLVKAFLASRQHCEKLCQMVLLMMDSGLPCFKPESVKNLRDRFMKDLIKKSASSYSTGVYDQFQLLTNGIPY